MSLLWLERWLPERACVVLHMPMQGEGFSGFARAKIGTFFFDDKTPSETNEIRAKLAAAAPLMVRALLQCEMCALPFEPQVACGGCGYGDIEAKGHQDGCCVDAALTAAGLATRQERLEAWLAIQNLPDK